MGKRLREDKIGLTFVAIDTFKWWGMAVGQVYLSHIGDRNIYWGSEKPDIDIFEKSVLFHYKKIRPLDGFVNVGQLADRVCRELKIAFIRFEEIFVQLCLQRRGYMTATSLLVCQPVSHWFKHFYHDHRQTELELGFSGQTNALWKTAY